MTFRTVHRRKTVGIHELIQKYDKHRSLMGLLSNVDSIIYVDVKKGYV